MSFSVPTLPGGMSADEFLRDYWQKKPLLIRQAFPGFESPLSADELAGLSLEQEVESRIVLEHGATPWELRRGPFAEDDYSSLPQQDWTLLVQAVDQFVPEVAELLAAFRFLPSWRVDDLMISFAAPGGSVGPHFDNYDVFLLQAEGHRRWKIGQMCDSDSPMLKHPDLRILAEFEQTEEWVLAPGDMLYLPPRLAHYGIAEDACMTWSVGFRAPSHAEVLTHFTDFLAQYLGDEQRYSDSDIHRPADPAQIDEQTVERLQQLILDAVQDREALGTWFGRFMTEPRYPELIQSEEIETGLLAGILDDGYGLERNPSARLAWRQEQDSYLMLFASGEHCLLPTRLLPLVQLICNQNYLAAEELQPWRADVEAMELLEQLLSKGDLLFEANEDDEHE